VTIIYLTRQPRLKVAECSAAPKATECDYYPRIHLSSGLEREAGYPSPLFVLHRMGFFLRSGLRRNPVGSYPAFSPLPSTSLASATTRLETMELQTGAGRSIFCDTLRHPRLSTRMPLFSQGILPSGVRTFLYPEISRQRSSLHIHNVLLKCVSCHPSLRLGYLAQARGADKSAPYRGGASTLRSVGAELELSLVRVPFAKDGKRSHPYPNCSRICFARIISEAFRTSRIGCSGSATLP
jgi:hypothetical protein